MRCLLDALDPDRLGALDPEDDLWSAITLDFDSGARQVDIDRLMRDWVQPIVQDQASKQTPAVLQTPQVDPCGAAKSGAPWPVYRLPDVPTSVIEMKVEPTEAVSQIQSMRVWFQERRTWERRLPRPPTATVRVP